MSNALFAMKKRLQNKMMKRKVSHRLPKYVLRKAGDAHTKGNSIGFQGSVRIKESIK